MIGPFYDRLTWRKVELTDKSNPRMEASSMVEFFRRAVAS